MSLQEQQIYDVERMRKLKNGMNPVQIKAIWSNYSEIVSNCKWIECPEDDSTLDKMLNDAINLLVRN